MRQKGEISNVVNVQLPAHTDPSTPLRADPSTPLRAGISDGSPPCGVSAFRPIDDELGQVKELIDKQLAEASEPFSLLLGTFSSCSGKMLRPGLVLLSYRAVRDASCSGRLRPDESCVKRNTQYEAIRMAAIVEMVHNAALLHDDVIDEGQKRRGLPTVNSLWGNESAVLLGDFLLSKVFKMCVELEPRFQRIIAATVVRICEGELSQIIQRQNWQLSESKYIEIITEKSAALFSSACLLGGLLGGASETQIHSLACFGLNTGIAFQITDDLLDIIGDESKMGKTPGNDVDKNKLTLAVIHLLRVVEREEKSAVIEMLNAPGGSKEALVEMLRSSGSLEYAHGRAQEFVAKAVQALVSLKESDAKDALIEAAGFVAGRMI